MDAPPKKSNDVQLTNRDLALLRGLFESRIMTADHIAALYFDNKRAYTTKRLQKIKAAGFLTERRRRMNDPAILFLTRKGFTLLKNEGMISEYPALSSNSFEARANVSEFTIRHELEIMDVKAAFHSALATSEKFSIEEFSTWPILHQFETAKRGHGAGVLVKPDGFIRIHEKEADGHCSAHECFLEVDRSSEKQDILINRANCYLEYYRTGGFAFRNGGTRDQFKEFPFRVLIILKSTERRNNTAARLVQNNPPILSLVWLATLAEVTADPLGAIWILPRDYREAVKGTAFDTERWPRPEEYKRQIAREQLIEQKVRKRRLLSDNAEL